MAVPSRRWGGGNGQVIKEKELFNLEKKVLLAKKLEGGGLNGTNIPKGYLFQMLHNLYSIEYLDNFENSVPESKSKFFLNLINFIYTFFFSTQGDSLMSE